jgi:hypothetical protein
VFVFDEAHLLFDDCPPALQQRIEQVVRLIRSKGVACISARRTRRRAGRDPGPARQPHPARAACLHAARHEVVKTAAETFVPNPKIDVAR